MRYARRVHRASLVAKALVLGLATLGLLACGAIDDIARAGIKAGARGTDEVVGAGAGHLDDAARKSAGKIDDVKPAVALEESDRLEGAVELAGEFALELAPAAFESDAPTPTSFVELVSQPKYVNLVSDPAAWTRLRDSSDAVKDAPWIFDARPQGDGVLVDNQVIAFDVLAATCWRLGTTCVFVGCSDDACSAATRSVFDAMQVQADMRVDAYTETLIDTRMTTAPQPSFMMFVGGSAAREYTLVRTKQE
jgi:hypothetical protein